MTTKFIELLTEGGKKVFLRASLVEMVLVPPNLPWEELAPPNQPLGVKLQGQDTPIYTYAISAQELVFNLVDPGGPAITLRKERELG